MENGKLKVLVLSDHALSTSGVGTQTRHLINGLLKKGRWTFRQFGGAIRHDDYRTVVVNPDFIIKPVDAFGTPELLRVTLATERPDVLLLFTDPRFFIWIWEMEDEIKQICPIAYWHVWDNEPTPRFNDILYDSTDLINCHSDITYKMVSENFPQKTNFIPHALPQDLFYKLDNNAIKEYRRGLLGEERADYFIAFWMNRNARRKRPNDVLLSWSYFIKNLASRGKKDALLIMHTDPFDQEGPNLQKTAEMLGIQDSVLFSNQRVDFEKVNIMQNMADVVLNISYAEGFGLGTLEAMQCGTPIIALKTGGLTRQVVDHRDGSENGVALSVETRSLVGSQYVPYIFEDYVSCETVAAALTKMYNLTPEEKVALSEKVRNYALTEFNYQKTIDEWDRTLYNLVKNWKRDSFTLETL